MIPAGIEPDLFDHVQPEKFREKYQLNGRPIIMYTGCSMPTSGSIVSCEPSPSLWREKRTRCFWSLVL